MKSNKTKKKGKKIDPTGNGPFISCVSFLSFGFLTFVLQAWPGQARLIEPSGVFGILIVIAGLIKKKRKPTLARE